MITRQEIEHIYDIIRELYLAEDIPWVLGYSGGKDSTATLQLVWYALKELPDWQRTRKPIHVISTDTLVESPVIVRWVEKSLEYIKEESAQQKMPFVVHRLRPDINQTFWVNLLGRGYPYPKSSFRWCTSRLKIMPSNEFIKSVVSEYGEAILLLGTRKEESARRAQNMERYEKMRVRDYLSPNGSQQNGLVFSPLEKWSSRDVWFYLMQYENPWNFDNKDLMNLYRGAAEDSECPIVTDLSKPSCGNSRFGCWVCTVVEKDKSMEAMIFNDSQKSWMTPLLEFRNEIADSNKDWERRDFRKMKGNVFPFKGGLVHGPYKRHVREEWLERLLCIQKNIRENGPKEYKDLELITIDELNAIRRIWLEEKHEFCDSLPEIYRRVMMEELPLDYCQKAPFGQTEWDLLKTTSEELYPKEELAFELAYRLIDVESTFSSLQKRKGIYTSLQNEIRRCYYQSEEDATEFALNRETRKKNYGLEYDVRAEALVNSGEEETEEDMIS
ncbi:MAG: DNA phosphorothioation system sulfurtransferase DndC [Blautia sp.]|jgi:DNA sulfur modification protein DndC